MKKNKWIALILTAAVCISGCGKADVPNNGTDSGKNEHASAAGSNSGHTDESTDTGSDTGSGSGNDENNDASGSGSHGAGTSDASSYVYVSVDGLSASGSGYEGTPGTGNFNYGEALQKSLLFYELQRSGKMPEGTRSNWKGDSCLKDGADAGLDLSGGWFDAGDNVKFNLPMAYSAAMLAWSYVESTEAYKESGQDIYMLNNLRFVCDYFIKCHPEDEVYYYQVGDGSADHSWWGPGELVETRMNRPSYCVTKDRPGSCVAGETAAALAAASVVFADTDPEYSELCLTHAKSLYKFAEDTKSDAGYTAANGFYNSWSGYYDELSWAGAWLYMATGDKNYLEKAEEYYPLANQDYNWAMCWDDVHIGAALLLAQLTEEKTYASAVEKHLDYWTVGTGGDRITYSPKGLAWLDSWGSLRYATTTAFLAAVYSEWDGCPKDRVDTYWDFAVAQTDYALGSTGFSYMVGFGDSYPKHVHHRTAQGSYCNNMNEPGTARHILFGALAGGPDANDGYTDEVSNYNTNEVACDYNAGFTGVLAMLYSRYHGQTLKDFGAVEEPMEEFTAEAAINVSGEDFIEIKAYVYNKSAWPARAGKDLNLRYFVNLSELYENGKTAADVEITTNYMQDATCDGLYCWDEENHIYYLSVSFTDGAVYPGGQENYKKEVQVRMRVSGGPWNNDNDYSHNGLSMGTVTAAKYLALYEEGRLVYGSEPSGDGSEGVAVTPGSGEGAGSTLGSGEGSGSGDGTSGEGTSGDDGSDTGSSGSSHSGDGSAKAGDISIKAEYNASGSSVNAIAGTITLKNEGTGVIALQDLKLRYYFTKDSDKTLIFDCYYCGMNGADGSYAAVNGVTGRIATTTEHDSDCVCIIGFSERQELAAGSVLTINFSLHNEDWSVMDMSNDYSAEDVSQIGVEY